MARASAARSPFATASGVTCILFCEPPVIGELYPVPARFSPGDRIHPDSSPAWKLDGRAAEVEAGDQAQEVHFETLDPAEGKARIAAEGNLNAGPARGQAHDVPKGLV